MNNNKNKIILEASYINELKTVLEYLVFHDEQNKAFELSKKLEKAVNDNAVEIKLRPDINRFYQDAILKLQFIALPLLDDKEVMSLIKNDFCFQLQMADYDLLQKIEAKLIGIILIEDRNKLKEDLKKILIENVEKISANSEIKLIKDWIRDYIAKVGFEGKDGLAKAQYLTGLRGNKNITSTEYDNLSALFKFYDRINTASDIPEGFDEEPPIEIDGKLFIFRKGALEPVTDNKEIDQAMALVGEKPLRKNNTSTDDLFLDKSRPAAQKNNSAPSMPEPELPVSISIEQALQKYPASSLEYKALKQELARLNKGTAKKMPATGVTQTKTAQPNVKR